MIKVFAVSFDCDDTVTTDVIAVALSEYMENKFDGNYIGFDVHQIFPKVD